MARRRLGRRGGARPTLVGLDGRARRRAAVRRASRPCGGGRQRRRPGGADGGAVHAGCGIRRLGARKRRLERRRAGARPALEGERGRRAGADRVGLAAGTRPTGASGSPVRTSGIEVRPLWGNGLIERIEVVALLFNVSDIAVTLTKIERLLGGDDGEEEADEG